MRRQQTIALAIRGATLVIVATLVGACAEDNGVDYCKNHGAFHADHLDTVATLAIGVTDAGDLKGRLSIPQAAFGEATESDIESLLSDAETTFALQSEQPCEVSVVRVVANVDGLEATFAASCGADNKIGKIDVSLFDTLSHLEEVVTSITTSATSKRFEISRQCDSPIFRLD